MSRTKVLLVGYNGANNTGSEALLQADIADVRAVLGPDALITVPTLNEANLRRYVQEGPNLRIAPIPTIYPFALRRLVAEHDLVMLVEGSTYMDTWTSAMLWAYLWTTHCAHAMGKPCLAYAVDAGTLSPFNQGLVRREASKTDLIITRNRGAAGRLREWGVSAPIEVTGDCAFTFQTEAADRDLLRREWPQSTSGVVGMAAVDFYLWPVVFRPWGSKERCYRWPYYFSHSHERARGTKALATGWAGLADRIVEEEGREVALICMEELDEPLAWEVYRHVKHANRVRVFSSRQYNASQMACLLQGLDLLITSRYHASVLSMAGQVPQMAVGHDTRLEELYRELGLRDEYFFPHDHPALWESLRDRARRLLMQPELATEALRAGYEENVVRASRNRRLLKRFVEDHGWEAAV